MKLWGFEIKRNEEDNLPGVSEPVSDDGATVVGGFESYGTMGIGAEAGDKSETELVTYYRIMEGLTEVDKAVNEIVCEAVVDQPKSAVVSIDLDETTFDAKVKKAIIVEFDKILSLLQFKTKPYDIFRRWFVDARLVYEVIIDMENPTKGILELRNIDPRKIQKIRQIKNVKSANVNGSWPMGVKALKAKGTEFYRYNPYRTVDSSRINDGYDAIAASGDQLISRDSIVYVTSGNMSPDNKRVIGELHKAIKTGNQLQMLEDATVIYRITRAPERLIFYVDTGNLPPQKAESLLQRMISQWNQKINYNVETGEVTNNKRFTSMTDNLWFSRREGGRATEVQTLPAGQNLGEIEDLNYFKDKLFEALNLPKTRRQQETVFSVGRQGEILREELKFQKFINRLRKRFSDLFLQILYRQLVLKNICTPEEWDEQKEHIEFPFVTDNEYAELKKLEILREKTGIAAEMGVDLTAIIPKAWVKEHIFGFTDEEMEAMAKQIDKEREEAPQDEGGDLGGGAPGGGAPGGGAF